MQKVDYNQLMKKQISEFELKPNLLLHSCCAPCSTAVLQKIKEFFNITVLYYNPNIYPQDEYFKRKNEQIKLLSQLNINFMDCDYNEDEFLSQIIGMENQAEGGLRCNKCFYLRLNKTAELATKSNFEYFGTTLTVSPHKDAQIINKIGEELQIKHNIKFLYSDFKKENGYLNSINISKELGLYRQNYCGCRFSIQNKSENNGNGQK